ncbi:MAG: hydrogenase maturation protease [Anaerolineales bacterium]|jgi:hydrogenase maturation protease|uniref:hydrogenase maturation protease n=1 Tax=Candidatus Villigracilis affinis TaxID=3140682 RepID=UPI001B50BD30|nr:hydrogenase maturation protease [Anaerolineales bacterium]MBK9604707.1 hydrogenase maturation protease [Anaerolineales bacterium]MBL0348603.1 hydrogenase maturation protease [Anaerolineales bacterium]MBP8048218.1 hydrogenase maturation protease [Anaerolineales bacterium]
MKTLVVGLGNPILGDDGVGWKVAEEVKKQLSTDSHVDVECLSLGGISLMEHLIGYPKAILVDAFALDEPVGSILILKLDDLPNYSAYHTTSAHDTSLQNAIELGKSMGAPLPDEITVVGIATKRVYHFSEKLSPPVKESVPLAAKFVLELIKQKTLVES